MSRNTDIGAATLRASLASLALALRSGLRSGIGRRCHGVLTAFARIRGFRRFRFHANTKSVLEDEFSDDGLNAHGDASLSRAD